MPALAQFLIFSFLLTILSIIPARSQEFKIQARIIDTTSLEPVAFSTVYVSDYSGTIADELGFFRLRLSPDAYFDTLHISCIGYLQKDLPVNSLNLLGLDSIYLQPGIIEIDEVDIHARARRAPRSKEIIKLAIERIPENYPDTAILYNGYYREYIKQEDEYINLFESIINLSDPGFQAIDNFDAGLMYKRINTDFRVDSPLMRPYDNRNKLVPFSVMPIPLNNELVILRAHDPVRNYNRKSLYFIECLQTDFIHNHNFNPPKLTYLGDRPYYAITFEDNRKYFYSNYRITANGTIYIDALNYGIKRINYRGTINTGTRKQKLFELSLEYRWTGDTYVLHYLSFNNLFDTRNFALRWTSMDEDRLALIFNRTPDRVYALNPENITVYLQNEEQEIKEIKLQSGRMLITFVRNSALSERLKINLLPRSIQNRNKIMDNEDFVHANLRVEFGEFKDLQGNQIAYREFDEYYQYREFFTNRVLPDQNGITRNMINKLIPVIDNRIYGEYSGDTSWLNTPLIEERVTARTLIGGNKRMNEYIEALAQNEENRLNETVYIHTDREMYAPDDTVWFKAYIRNGKYLTASSLSRTFDILLVSKWGRVIRQEKYLAGESGAHGQFFLDHNLEEGIYYILGYSSWMKNFGNQAMFCKRIMVSKDKLDGFQLVAAFDRQEYFPGDTVRLLVNCYDDFKREVDDVSFSYRFVAGREMLQEGSGNTDKSWLDPILLVVPGGLEQNPAVQFRSSFKSQRLDTLFTLPVAHAIHVDFFPEGGSCINGAESIMAFKALTGNGNPVDIEGEIVDQEGKILAEVRSSHDGMGKFACRPEENRPCFLRLTRPGGIDRVYFLPEARSDGWLLKVNAGDPAAIALRPDELEVEISNVHAENDTALLTLMIRGYLCHYELIRTGRKRTVKIPLEDLPGGIGVLTLFDSRLLPRAERLVYIPPARNIRASISTDRERYIPRDSLRLTIRLAADQSVTTGGSYSLSVVDDQLCSTDMLDEPDIRTSLLLSPEIHGKIHNLNDYLEDENENAEGNLDLLLMTQGWRNYRYPDEFASAAGKFKPVDMDVISGSLMRQPLGAEMRPVEGTLSVLFGGNTSRIPVGKDGGFSFLPDYSPGFNSGLLLQAEDRNGGSNLSIVLNSTGFEDQLTAYLGYLVDSLGREPLRSIFNRERFQDRFSLGMENHQWLEEVVISKKVVKKEMSIADLAFDSRKATPDELMTAVRMEDLELRVRKLNVDRAPVYYCIDGILQFRYVTDGISLPVMVPDYSYAYYILPENIEEYTVISGPEVEALYGYGIRYVIDVQTKAIDANQPRRPWDNPVSIPKLAMAKEFYSPVYDTEAKKRSPVPDLRKTIHWEPELQFDENGVAEILFYNGDRYTRVRCVLEGITGEGIPVHAEHYYNVTLTREE
jgi:hypothetical protein